MAPNKFNKIIKQTKHFTFTKYFRNLLSEVVREISVLFLSTVILVLYCYKVLFDVLIIKDLALLMTVDVLKKGSIFISLN